MAISGWKGFDKDFRCRGYQYEVGGRYETDRAEACQAGFHFCEDPLDTFRYYAPATSRFATVTGDGDISRHDEDSKLACTHLHVGAEVSLHTLIQAGLKFRFDRVKWADAPSATGYQGSASATGSRGAASATGSRGAASATGYQGAASATGYQGSASATGCQGSASATGDQGSASATGDQGAASATGYQGSASATGYQGAASATGCQGSASATGYQGAASATGTESIALATGCHGKAKGALGCWLVLAEWRRQEDGWHREDVQCIRVDGEHILPDTWYRLVDGSFIVSDDD